MRHAVESLRKDPILAAIIEQVGEFEMRYREPSFDSLVRSIVSQQISSKVARVFIERLIARMPDGQITPANILRLRRATLRKIGLSAAKTEYIRDLAKLTASGALDFPGIGGLADEEVIERLTQVKGVGVWTAQMFLMFALRRPDVLPTGDQGIRAAIKKAYGLEALPSPAEMAAIAEAWRPWCSVACWYLWRSLDGTAAM